MYTFDKYYDGAHHKGPVYMQKTLWPRERTITVDSGRLNVGLCEIIPEMFYIWERIAKQQKILTRKKYYI